MPDDAPESGAEPTVKAVLNAIDVLSCIAEWDAPSVGVTEIAAQLALPKAAVYRLLSSLRVKGLVEMDEKTHRYSLGLRVLTLGETYRARVDLRALCRAEMADLVRRTDETATLSIRHGGKRTYIDQITPSRDVKMVVQIGQEYPLHLGASSKAFLAFLSADEQVECIAELAEQTATAWRALRDELAMIRDRGYAVSLGERDPSAGSVAAPLFGAGSPVPVAVMSVCGPVERFSAEMPAIPELLCAATRRVSARLGHVPPA